MMMQETEERCKLAHRMPGLQAQQSRLHWLRLCRRAARQAAFLHTTVQRALFYLKFFRGC